MSKDIIIVYTDGSSYIHNRGKKDLPKRYFAAYAFAEIDTVKGQVIYQESGAKEHLKTGGV